MNTELIGQNFLPQKRDPTSKKKEQWKTAYFFLKSCKHSRKKTYKACEHS